LSCFVHTHSCPTTWIIIHCRVSPGLRESACWLFPYRIPRYRYRDQKAYLIHYHYMSALHCCKQLAGS
jgi:hypothetical protein